MTSLLSKSKFKIAADCLTKLYYKANGFKDTSVTDPFLAALAEGGFQVGEMAKDLYSGGVDIDTLDSEKALELTNELLKQDEVIIYEAAIQWNGCIIRVDVLHKIGNVLELIEAKSKSYSITDTLRTKQDTIRGEYHEYLCDVAFQTYVARKAFPEMEVKPFLFLVNKEIECNDNFLNQRYVLYKENNRTFVKINEEIPAPIDELLVKIDCQREVKEFVETIGFFYNDKLYSLAKYVELAKDVLNNGLKPVSKCDKSCKGCEFKDGFEACWSDKIDLSIPMVWDINNLHYTKKAKLMEAKKYMITDITEEDKTDYKLNERQLTQLNLQIKNLTSNKVEMDVKYIELEKEIMSFTYPLHFIDFETIAPAIPMNKGLRPYEAMLFQFSHHVMYEDGQVEHKTEYINTVKGLFPSIKAVRELKKALENDNGTIFRYHNHENTILNMIRKQMLSMIENGTDEPDFLELIEFIESITQRDVIEMIEGKNGKPKKNKVKVKGKRNMVDLCEMIKKYYYSTIMGGSNSIKFVLPSVLNTSEFLKDKYSESFYCGKNFNKKVWIVRDENGEIENPYNLLGANVIKNGGDAMTGYAHLQYVDSSKEFVKTLKKELLAYCELDTLAMVFIYEHFLELLGMFEHLHMPEDKIEIDVSVNNSYTVLDIEADNYDFDAFSIEQDLEQYNVTFLELNYGSIRLVVEAMYVDEIEDYFNELQENN